MAKFSGKKNEAEMVADVAKMAMAELGHTSRTAIEAMERVANQRAAIRLLVSAVGESCSTLRLGAPENGAIAVNRQATGDKAGSDNWNRTFGRLPTFSEGQ